MEVEDEASQQMLIPQNPETTALRQSPRHESIDEGVFSIPNEEGPSCCNSKCLVLKSNSV